MSPASGSRCCATSASFQARIANRELIIHSIAHGRKFGIQNSTFELHKNSRACWAKLTSLLRSQWHREKQHEQRDDDFVRHSKLSIRTCLDC